MHGDERVKLGERDALDARIDAALRRYAEAPQFSEAREALARVRKRTEQEQPRRSWRRVWIWAVPAAAAALIAIAVLTMLVRAPRYRQIARAPKAPAPAGVMSPNMHAGEEKNAGPSIPVATATSAQDDNASGPSTSLRRSPPHQSLSRADNAAAIRAAEQPRLPKLEVFPTPQPLSPQERALVAFATQSPPGVTKQVLEAQQHFGDPIEIAALKIRPLQMDEQQVEPKGKDIR